MWGKIIGSNYRFDEIEHALAASGKVSQFSVGRFSQIQFKAAGVADCSYRDSKKSEFGAAGMYRDGNGLIDAALVSGVRVASVSVVSGPVSSEWLSLAGERSRKAQQGVRPSMPRP